MQVPLTVERGSLRRILVIQLGPFGDVLLTTAYFEQLKRDLPGVYLAYLMKEPYHKIVRNHPLIDELITIRRRRGIAGFIERLRTVLRIRRGKFDLVIDQQNKNSSRFLTLLSGARYRLGYADAKAAWVYNLKAPRGPRRYSANRKFDILTPLNFKEELVSLHYIVTDESRRYIAEWAQRIGIDLHQTIVFSPDSPVAFKRWSMECWVELAKLIAERLKLEVLLLWGPGEEDFVRKIHDAARNDRVILCPPTDFNQAGALLQKTRLFVCNDGGINHLAAAIGVETVAIFGRTNPLFWSPASFVPTHHHLHRPSADRNDPTFGISAAEAFAYIDGLLAPPPLF